LLLLERVIWNLIFSYYRLIFAFLFIISTAMQSSVGASAAPSSAYSPSSTGPDRAQGSEALRLSPSIGDREEDESDNDDNDEGSGEEAEVNSEPAWGGLGHDVVGAGVDDSSSGDTTWNDYQSKVAEAQRRQRELADAENQLRRQQQAERERADQKAQDDAEANFSSDIITLFCYHLQT
jgi:hypothetical protein